MTIKDLFWVMYRKTKCEVYLHRYVDEMENVCVPERLHFNQHGEHDVPTLEQLCTYNFPCSKCVIDHLSWKDEGTIIIALIEK